MSPSKLLIVDDDRDFADGLAEVMEMLGHRGDAACARAKRSRRCGNCIRP